MLRDKGYLEALNTAALAFDALEDRMASEDPQDLEVRGASSLPCPGHPWASRFHPLPALLSGR